MNTVVVTGGAGFIGSHLIQKLVALGMIVHVIDDLSSGHADRIHPQAFLHIQDIRSTDAFQTICSLQPDTVFHLAAQADVQHSIREPLSDMDINVGGTLNILNACRKAGVRKVIFASTSGVYGDLQKGILTEDDPVLPISFYGLSKLTAEHYIRLYSHLFGLSYTVLRFANVYGPGQTVKGEGGVIAIFMDQLLKELPLSINGDGNQTRDFIYVKDVVEAITAAKERGAGETLHVSTGKGTSLNHLIDLLRGFHPKDIQLLHLAEKAGDIRHSCLSNDQARIKLLWNPSYIIEQGLKETYRSCTSA